MDDAEFICRVLCGKSDGNHAVAHAIDQCGLSLAGKIEWLRDYFNHKTWIVRPPCGGDYAPLHLPIEERADATPRA
jgi:hypothetical protein